MFARIFIHRPVLAIVVSLVILIAGALSILALPVSQFPQIVPPTVIVTANYIGASAQVVADTVATPIEQQVNGVEDMMYMQSRSTNDGRMQLTVTFKVGTDLDIATVNVQNRVNQASSMLPPAVMQSGVTVAKQNSQILVVAQVYAPKGEYDTLFLSNYVSINMMDQLSRVQGVGLASILTGRRDYCMRVWVRPDKLAKLGVDANEISRAITEQNQQAAAGAIGQPPVPAGSQFQYQVQVKGRLDSVEDFANIIVRTQPDGSILRVRDVGRVELGAQDYGSFSRRNGAASISIGIYQTPEANAMDVATLTRAKLKELSASFPPGLEYDIALDTTDFVRESIKDVIKTLGEAILLVLIVVLIFLGNFRATLIPMLAVPVSLVGTFASFVVLGFSINTLTLFALVLAVGIVVDDAIVVVEAVEHHIEEGLDPVAATEKAMDEVSGPVVAIALVLCAVFVPVAFMGGITGQLYKQFAITLAVSVCLSALVALTLTPALCAMLLRHRTPMGGPLGWFLAGFNWAFGHATTGYTWMVRRTMRMSLIMVLLLGGVYYGAYHLQKIVPTGFIPNEDNGYLMVNVSLPDAASLERTDAVLKQMEAILAKEPAVRTVVTLGGLSLITSSYSSNYGSLFVVLKPWEERDQSETAFKILPRIQKAFNALRDADIQAFNPPPIPGLGNSGGFTFELQDRSGKGPDELARVTNEFLGVANHEPAIAMAYTLFRPNVPQVKLDVDRDKVKVMGVSLSDVFTSLGIDLGGYFVNQFNKFGRTWRVYIQAEPEYRTDPKQIGEIYVRSDRGAMVPLSTLTSWHFISGPDSMMHYNLYNGAEINGQNKAAFSSGQGIAAMEKAAKNLPEGYGFEWTGTALQEKMAGGAQALILLLGLIFVFLFLAAQYESWGVPLSIILGIPVCIVGAYLATWIIKMDSNTYVQIGMVMLVGLAAKNAILIVEFAKEKHEKEGMGLMDAAVKGAQLRFRPILMTSFAFILGVVPLVTATGAGGISRNALGTAVFGGMLASSSLGIFFIPWLYVLIQGTVYRLTGKKHLITTGTATDESVPTTTSLIAVAASGAMQAVEHELHVMASGAHPVFHPETGDDASRTRKMSRTDLGATPESRQTRQMPRVQGEPPQDPPTNP